MNHDQPFTLAADNRPAHLVFGFQHAFGIASIHGAIEFLILWLVYNAQRKPKSRRLTLVGTFPKQRHMLT